MLWYFLSVIFWTGHNAKSRKTIFSSRFLLRPEKSGIFALNKFAFSWDTKHNVDVNEPFDTRWIYNGKMTQRSHNFWQIFTGRNGIHWLTSHTQCFVMGMGCACFLFALKTPKYCQTVQTQWQCFRHRHLSLTCARMLANIFMSRWIFNVALEKYCVWEKKQKKIRLKFYSELLVRI